MRASQHGDTLTHNTMLHKPIFQKSKAWLLYVCLLICLGGCQQCVKAPPPSKLPDATQTGAKTFGCVLNGNLWVAQGRGTIFNAPVNPNCNYDATFKGGTLDVGGAIIIDNSEKSNIGITGSNISALGEYTEKNSQIRFKHTDFLASYIWYIDECISTYKLVITKNDLQNRIISGTFEFSMIRKDNGAKLIVTDGRFDMKYL